MIADQLVILSALEQEYLIHAIEAALPVRDARQFFLWTQGQFQALLPHRVMVCMQFGAHDELLHIDCLHSAMLDPGQRQRLADRDSGLALRLARHVLAVEGRLPALLDATPLAPGNTAVSANAVMSATSATSATSASAADPMSPFEPALRTQLCAELGAEKLDNVLLHGSGRLPGGASVIALFGLPCRPRRRHAYFMELLLPYIHLALQRMRLQGAQAPQRAGVLARPVSPRETEILYWVREGKSNDEIGMILGISGLTVKNHLQRLYRLLNVSNRAHALARCMALGLFEGVPQRLARAA